MVDFLYVTLKPKDLYTVIDWWFGWMYRNTGKTETIETSARHWYKMLQLDVHP